MEFTKVFIIGLIILVGFYIIFGGFQFIQEAGNEYKFVPATRNATPTPGIVEEENFVGNREVEDFKNFFLSEKPFKVTRVSREESLVSFKNLWIENGLFNREDYTKTFTLTDEEIEKLKESKISINVDATNLYGRLIIGLNGKRIFSDFVEAGKEIPVNVSLFKKTNNLVVTAESSSWRIWAPTVYVLDLNLESSFFGESSQSFGFVVPKNDCPVKYARIILSVQNKTGSGNLVVRLNNNMVFNSTPTSRQWIEFNDTVKCGNNTIGMVSEGNVNFDISGVQVVIFWERNATKNLEYNLEISSYQYNQLPGKIYFKIDKIFGEPTSLDVKIIDTRGHGHSSIVQGIIEEGKTISIDIPKDYVGIGDNKVVFSVTGDGGLTISNIRIVY